jgi:hypothetical protein
LEVIQLPSDRPDRSPIAKHPNFIYLFFPLWPLGVALSTKTTPAKDTPKPAMGVADHPHGGQRGGSATPLLFLFFKFFLNFLKLFFKIFINF